MVWSKFLMCQAQNVLTNVPYHGSKTVIRFILCLGISIVTDYIMLWGVGATRWRSWLRHCATSRKVVGSFPNGAIGIFN
jgi:hypothetical protein